MPRTKPTTQETDFWGSGGAVTTPSASKTALGWISEIPTHQLFNGILQECHKFNAHINDWGIVEWDGNTAYPEKAWIRASDGDVYFCNVANVNKDPLSNPTEWTEFSAHIGGATSGDLKISMDVTIPTGWVNFLDGRIVSRTGTYASIFARYGTTYGVGDGSTTFQFPQSLGMFMRIMDDGQGVDPDAGSRTDRGDGTTGDNIGTKQTDELESHNHSIVGSNVTGAPRTTVVIDGNGTGDSQNTNSVGGNETRPTNFNVRLIVKL